MNGPCNTAVHGLPCPSSFTYDNVVKRPSVLSYSSAKDILLEYKQSGKSAQSGKNENT